MPIAQMTPFFFEDIPIELSGPSTITIPVISSNVVKNRFSIHADYVAGGPTPTFTIPVISSNVVKNRFSIHADYVAGGPTPTFTIPVTAKSGISEPRTGIGGTLITDAANISGASSTLLPSGSSYQGFDSTTSQGTLSGITPYQGATILALASDNIGGLIHMVMSGLHATNFWANFRINGTVYSSTLASSVQEGANTRWTFGSETFGNSISYIASIYQL